MVSVAGRRVLFPEPPHNMPGPLPEEVNQCDYLVNADSSLRDIAKSPQASKERRYAERRILNVFPWHRIGYGLRDTWGWSHLNNKQELESTTEFCDLVLLKQHIRAGRCCSHGMGIGGDFWRLIPPQPCKADLLNSNLR